MILYLFFVWHAWGRVSLWLHNRWAIQNNKTLDLQCPQNILKKITGYKVDTGEKSSVHFSLLKKGQDMSSFEKRLTGILEYLAEFMLEKKIRLGPLHVNFIYLYCLVSPVFFFFCLIWISHPRGVRNRVYCSSFIYSIENCANQY